MNEEQIQTLGEQYTKCVKRGKIAAQLKSIFDGEFDMAEAKAAAEADKVVDHVPPFWKSESAEITDKKGFAKRWGFSVRTVDNFLAKGLPHLKCGARRIRIVVADGDAWMHQQYGTRRNG